CAVLVLACVAAIDRGELQPRRDLERRLGILDECLLCALELCSNHGHLLCAGNVPAGYSLACACFDRIAALGKSRALRCGLRLGSGVANAANTRFSASDKRARMNSTSSGPYAYCARLLQRARSSIAWTARLNLRPATR